MVLPLLLGIAIGMGVAEYLHHHDGGEEPEMERPSDVEGISESINDFLQAENPLDQIASAGEVMAKITTGESE